MSLPPPTTEDGARALAAIFAYPGGSLLALDFDGTLAPIVDDPENAYADPAAVSALGRIGALMQVVVITGRPARTAVQLGGFDQVAGLGRMIVLGQYGIERWNAETREFVIPPEPPEIVAVVKEIGDILGPLGLEEALVEHKGRAVGVHTRQLPNPAGALRDLTGPLTELAARNGLQVEPGKNVLEIRASGFDKGDALRGVLAEFGSQNVIFAGDDLGDLPAFRLVHQLREGGEIHGLLVCSASHEEDALTEISDVVVAGSVGVAEWLNALADELERVG